jgi:hypothetical protein
MNGRTDRLTLGQAGSQSGRKIDGWKDRQKDIQTDRSKNGWTNRQTYRMWTNVQAERQKGTQIRPGFYIGDSSKNAA